MQRMTIPIPIFKKKIITYSEFECEYKFFVSPL